MITILNWAELSEAEKNNVLERPAFKINDDMQKQVANIIATVRRDGDQAVKDFTQRFDHVDLEQIRVTQDEVEQARAAISEQAFAAMTFARDQILKFHELQMQHEVCHEVAEDSFCTRQTRAIAEVGLYVPGGEAPLPSTLLMLAVPANIAGCKRIVVCTPPKKAGFIDPSLLVAADLCGITEIYKIGGAQAIAAMAYGTPSLPKVDKIFGPGNAWVTAAKLAVMNDLQGAHVDLPAGPSELVVIADQCANPEFIAADLLAQAEHSHDAQVLFITDSLIMAEKVLEKLTQQLACLNRQTVCRQSLAFAKIIVVAELATAFEISDRYAPEHLSIQVKEPDKWLPAINNAGAVFVGDWTAQTLGDYVLGSNHVLPTYGFSRVYSGLCVNDFLKQINFHKVSMAGLQQVANQALSLAGIEQLDAHQNAIAIRLRFVV